MTKKEMIHEWGCVHNPSYGGGVTACRCSELECNRSARMTQGKFLFYLGYPLWLIVIGLVWVTHNVLFGKVSYIDTYRFFKTMTGVE